MNMLTKESPQQVHADPLAHLTKHPTYGLVHQVVWMVQMDFSIAQTP